MTARPHRSARSAAVRNRGLLPGAAAPSVAAIRHGLLATTALLPVALLAAPAMAQAPSAAPSGGLVSAGSAAISQSATTTRIDQTSTRAAIDWQRFDVGRNHTVQFNQPNAQSWTLNRVNTPDPSMIAGRIQANGGVAIVNQSGVVFAPGAQVNVGSLIVSAAGITNQNFMAGRMMFDQPARPGARVENHGNITVAERGLASLVAPGVANSGLIRARLGRVALAGAETFTLDLAGDGLVSLDVTQSVRRAPEGAVALVTNSGTIEAAGGSVLLTADAARGVVDTMLRNTGRISADGDATAAAGSVVLRGGAGGDVRVDAGTISATGTAPGARGGSVQVGSAGGAVSVAREARLDASGAGGGGAIRIGGATTGRATVAGEVAARGTGARVRGGLVTVQAKESVLVAAGAKLDASGTGGGGTVLTGTTGIGREQTMAATTTVEAGAELRADATDAGDGGVIVVNSTERTEVRGSLAARGGPQGGDGGFIELSGLSGLTLAAEVLLDAPAGRGGTVLIDPDTINLDDDGDANEPPVAGTPGRTAGAILFADGGGGTIDVDVDAINSFTAGVNVLLQANNTINVKAEVNRSTAGSVFLETKNTGTINVDADMRAQNGSLGFRTGTLALDNVTLNASTDISVSADTLSTRNGVTLNAPTLSLRADTFTLKNSNVFSGSTLVEIGPRSVGTAASAFVPGNGITITTALLRLGRTTAGNRTWGSPDDTEVTADDLVLTSSITRAGTNLELFATDLVQLQSAVNIGSGQLALRTTAAAGQVVQDAAASITASRLSGQSGTGGFNVADTANALGSLGDIASTGNVTVRSTGNLSIVGAVSGGSAGVVRISAAGALGVSATGSVSAGDLGGTDPAPVAGTGRVHLWGSSVTLAGAVTGGEAVTLAASSDPDSFVAGGAVTQSGVGSIRAGELAVLSGGDVTLGLTTNRILSVGSESFGAGTTAIRSDRAMTVTATPTSVPHPDGSGPTTPTAGITAQGDVRLAAPALTIDAALVASGDATSGVTLVADALTFGAPGLIQPGAALTPGTVTIARFTDGVIDLGGAGAVAGALEITSTELNAIAFAGRLRIGGGFSGLTLPPSGAGGSSVQVTAPLDLTALSIGTL
ncbi:filamentous hemagglutinin N-terminal domain-containing protein, partial [Falsiroseomonas sp.]|uniref:two-partner secretion domain-containing protein n=1 Tax=Falsiroseomonas sp. TaxID=2870721 RepID=UPI00356A7B43